MNDKDDKKQLDEEDIQDAAGGFPGMMPGSPQNPHREGCWFSEGGPPSNMYGATRYPCATRLCKAVPFGKLDWYQCKCHGFDECIQKWHKHGSKAH